MLPSSQLSDTSTTQSPQIIPHRLASHTQIHQFSISHDDEHPSKLAVLPSSHVSHASINPSPHVLATVISIQSISQSSSSAQISCGPHTSNGVVGSQLHVPSNSTVVVHSTSPLGHVTSISTSGSHSHSIVGVVVGTVLPSVGPVISTHGST